MYPYSEASILTKGINLLKNIKWASILDGTSKTLGVINQAIPIVYQIKPIVSNTKTLFKIANTINTPDNTNNTIQNTQQTEEKNISNNSPIFYI